MPPELPSIVQLAILMVFPAGAAWGAARSALNGTRKRVERIEDKLDVAIGNQGSLAERIARLEGEHARQEVRR